MLFYSCMLRAPPPRLSLSISICEAEPGFVSEENMEPGEELVRAVKAFDGSKNFLCAGALLDRYSESASCHVHDTWIADSIEYGVGPNLQIRGAQGVLDELFLTFLENTQDGDESPDWGSFNVLAGSGKGTTMASRAAALSRGFTVEATCDDSAEALLRFDPDNGLRAYRAAAKESPTAENVHQRLQGCLLSGTAAKSQRRCSSPHMSALKADAARHSRGRRAGEPLRRHASLGGVSMASGLMAELTSEISTVLERECVAGGIDRLPTVHRIALDATLSHVQLTLGRVEAPFDEEALIQQCDDVLRSELEWVASVETTIVETGASARDPAIGGNDGSENPAVTPTTTITTSPRSRLVRVTPTLSFVLYELSESALSDTRDAYGSRLWPAAAFLARYLAQAATTEGAAASSIVLGRSVLELGCGNGLVSLTAARLGVSTVLATDYRSLPLRLVHKA